MAAVFSNTALPGLTRALVQARRLSQSDAETVNAAAKTANSGFVEQLVASKKMAASDIAHFASDTFGYPLLDLASYDSAQLPKDAIDKKLVRQHRVLALSRRGNRLMVAISDPTNTHALDQIKADVIGN